MSLKQEFIYNAFVNRVVDGDTYDLDLDLGLRVTVRIRVRLLGANTPETYGVPRDSDEYKAGRAAAAVVRTFFAACESCVVIKTSKTGKYGRWLATIENPEGDDLATHLLELGHAQAVDADGNPVG